MNKIQEIIELQSKAREISSTMITKLEDLTASTEKYIFSVNFDKGFYANIRNKRQDIALSLDLDEVKVLYDFLQSIFNDDVPSPQRLVKK